MLQDSIIILQQSLLQSIVGRDPQQSGDLKLQWANLPQSWGVFVLIAVIAAVVLGVFWLYRREIDTCPIAVKWMLAGLRLAVLLMLIAMFLKPSIFYQQVSELKPSIVLLRDSSLSLARGDKYRDPQQVQSLAKLTGLPPQQIADGSTGRSKLINEAFKKHPQWIAEIRDKGSVRISDFSDRIEQVAVLPATTSNKPYLKRSSEAPHQPGDENSDQTTPNPSTGSPEVGFFPPLVADGLGTNVWQALRDTLEDSSRLSSVVLISEGQHNGDQDPIELAEKAAGLGIPIYTVGVGDPNPPKNLAIREIYVRNKAYPDEPFEIEAVLQTSRRDETKLPPQLNVSLLEQKVNPASGKLDSPRTLKTRPFDVPTSGGRVRIDFDHVTNQPGKYVYTVAVEELADETQLTDNQLSSSVLEVVDEKVKVLLISGLPNWDYQHVQRLLQRDPTIDLSCWLQSMDQSRPQEGNFPIDRLPRSMEELGRYNVVLLIDPDPSEFDGQWIELLKDFCKFKAGGVLFMAGPQFTSEFISLNRLQPFRQLLPVRFGDSEFIDATQALASASENEPGKMMAVGHNLDHPVMSFKADPLQSRKVWDVMPGISWSFPTVSAQPTARVLLERGDQIGADGNQPLLVSGRFGAGSVLYLGFQGTWRWRSLGLQAQYFDRFWIQVIRFLVETRSLQGSRRGFLDREKSEYELGDRVTLVARILDAQFQPSTQSSVNAVLTSDDGRIETVEMKLLPQQKGRYEGTFEAKRLGNYEATIDLGSTEENLIDPIAFRIVTPSAETNSYWLDRKLMAEIAQRSGGQYLPLDEIELLPGLLPTKVTRAEFNSPPKPLWDASQFLRWTVFLIPAVLLSLEWALRKYYKLL
jgi:uncharacterized membrane protein/5-hydroxyisourate hydrolase-like protein (transthyretin family)